MPNTKTPLTFFGEAPEPDYAAEERADLLRNPDAAAMAAEAEDRNKINDALNANPFSCSPSTVKALQEFEQEDRANFSSDAGQEAFLDFLSNQHLIDRYTATPTFFSTPAPKPVIPERVSSPESGVVTTPASKPVVPEDRPTPNPDVGTKPDANTLVQKNAPIKHPKQKGAVQTPYEAADWLIKNLALVNAGGRFFFYHNGCYFAHTRDEVCRLILDACRPSVEASGNSSFVRQVYDFLVMESRICRDEDMRQNLISFQDCVLNVSTWHLYPHSPNLFVTTALHASYEVGRHSDCPVFKAFLNKVTGGDPVLTQRIWEAIGYLLVPDQAGKAFIFFQGVPSSGKSVLGDFIRNCFVGDAVSPLEINELNGNFTLSDLVGKKLCVDLDLPADPFDKKAISKLKKLTGGDFVSSDVKFCERIKFINTAKFLFASNHAILLSGQDPAFFNRLIVIPFAFSVDPSDRDFQLPQKLACERDAIVFQALMAYRQLAANNYQFAGHFLPNECLGDGQDSCPDAIAVFLRECCRVSEGSWVPTADLYQAFTLRHGALCSDKQFSAILLQLCQTQHLPVEKRRARLSAGSNPIYGFWGLELLEGGVKHA